jgi:hypothetical protein
LTQRSSFSLTRLICSQLGPKSAREPRRSIRNLME